MFVIIFIERARNYFNIKSCFLSSLIDSTPNLISFIQTASHSAFSFLVMNAHVSMYIVCIVN